MEQSDGLKGSCENQVGLVYVQGGRSLLCCFRGLPGLFRFLQLDGNTPKELSPRISFLIPRTFIIWKFTSFTTNESDRLAVPILGEVKGDPSRNSERKFWTELEKSVTEVCRNEILMSGGIARP